MLSKALLEVPRDVLATTKSKYNFVSIASCFETLNAILENEDRDRDQFLALMLTGKSYINCSI